MKNHKQVVRRGNILVDKKLAPLLEVLWDRGITTMFSCQGTKTPDPKFQTAINYMSYIMMIRDDNSLQLVREIAESDILTSDKKSKIVVEFDYNSMHGYRVTLRFPQNKIGILCRELRKG